MSFFNVCIFWGGYEMGKFLKIVLPIIVIFIIIIIVFYQKENVEEPTITINFHISKLMEDEFNKLERVNYEDSPIDDFRILTYKVDMKHSHGITSRKIVVPDIEKVINAIDETRVIHMTGWEQDNAVENFVTYNYEFVYFSKGLSDEDVKKALSSKFITISWETMNGKGTTKKFNVGALTKIQ